MDTGVKLDDTKLEWAKKGTILKLADRIANARACAHEGHRKLGMYRKEHPAFREALFREGWADAMWTELDKLLA